MQDAYNKTIAELKPMIAELCDIDDDVIDKVKPDEPLVGAASGLQLDSLDSLEIIVAVQNRFGVKVDDKHTAQKILKNLTTLAEFIDTHRTIEG
jgi:acyl carrier protein